MPSFLFLLRLPPNSISFYQFSLNIFILHRLRNKFLQLILISLDSASWELHQYSRRMCGPMKNPKVETRSRDSNSGPHDCKVDALPHDHGHHNFISHVSYFSIYTTNQIVRFKSSVTLEYHYVIDNLISYGDILKSYKYSQLNTQEVIDV